ncbi:MAG: PH domain-containing protein [Acidobacteriota bacterium]|nr:PH domain-containing protein [Blastocatellia bacterium]MDW8238098.1 PH domain-containing protein [Acidobacteriota bacterium]
MRCSGCGHLNPAGSRFCNACGAGLSASPSLAKELNDEEQVVLVLRPSLIFVVCRYLIALMLIGAAGAAYWFAQQYRPGIVPWWSLLIVGVLLLLPAVYHHILRQREVYTLTNRKIELTYGLIAKLRRNIPLSKVQDVTVTQTVMERLLGIGDIVIDSAAQGGKIPLRNIPSPSRYADVILHQVQEYQR